MRHIGPATIANGNNNFARLVRHALADTDALGEMLDHGATRTLNP